MLSAIEPNTFLVPGHRGANPALLRFDALLQTVVDDPQAVVARLFEPPRVSRRLLIL